MRENRVKAKLARGERSIGTTIFEFATSGIGRIAAEAGAEFIIFDLEHTTWSVETARRLLAESRSADIMPIVRPPATEYHLIAPLLDAGAMGILIPTVESAAQARLAADSMKYPPLGRRGCAFGIAHDDYTGGDPAAKMTSANAETMLIALIETPAGVAHADAIAAVPGVDSIWIGILDLSATLGVPGQFTHPSVEEAIERVLAACAAHGRTPGIPVGGPEDGHRRITQGFRAIAYSIDIAIYQSALRAGISALRQTSEERQP